MRSHLVPKNPTALAAGRFKIKFLTFIREWYEVKDEFNIIDLVKRDRNKTNTKKYKIKLYKII